MPECYFAPLGGCDGRLVKAHLVPKQRIRRELMTREAKAIYVDPESIVWDPRVWRWMCGGPTGIGGHHGMYDNRTLKLQAVPEDLREFLREYGIEWMAEAYVERHIPTMRE